MIDLSTEFRNELEKDNRNFLPFLDITLKDGTVLNLTKSEIWQNSFKVEDATSASGKFTIGAAVTGKLTVTINNIYGDFSEYDFADADVIAYVGLQLSETLEKLRVGTYTVDEPSYDGSTITLSLLDGMTKFDRPYSESTLQYPATLGEIIIDACQCCDVTLLTTTFDNSDYVVSERPNDEALTFGDIIACVAQIACKWAKMDAYGRLKLDWYNMSVFDDNVLDGGTFKTNTTPYSDGDNVDGGNFTDYSSGDSYDGGTFIKQRQYHHIYSTKSFTISTDDVVITGVRVTEEFSETEQETKGTYLSGDDGYVIDVSGNALIQKGKAQAVSDYLYGKIGGMKFRPLSISALTDPSIESGDVAYFTDRNGNTYQAFISNRTFTLGGTEEISCDAETPSKNSAKSYSEMTKAVVKARTEAKKNLGIYDLAVQQLTNLMSQSFGVFKSEEKQADGSVIYYMHNKPKLSDSSTIWKMTADAFAVSTDGGETWNAGLDSEGNAVLNVLSAIGINFDWARGGTLKLGGTDNVDGVMEVYNADGKLVCKITKDGLETNSAKITGGTVNIATSSAEHSAISLNYITESGATFSLRQSPMLLAIDQIWDENVESHITLTGQSLMLEKTIGADPVTTILKPNFLSFSIGQDEVGTISADSNGILISGEEYGSNSNGYYHKFHDGTLICTKQKEISTTCNNAWGALYDSSVIDMGNWPMSFVDTPTIHAEFCTDSSFAWLEGFNGVSATSAGQTYLCRATDTGTLITGKLHITGIGRWR